jgi:two-component system, sensor histidine kinase
MKILFADGDQAFVRKAEARFRSLSDPAVQAEMCAAGADFLDRAYAHAYDLIFLDATLPGTDPLEILKRLLQTTLPMPIVMLSAREDARLAVQAMKQGVLDFLIKDDFLALDLSDFLRRLEEVSRARRADAELAQVNQMKNDFLATISHELRTPLTSILGLSDVLVSGRMGPLEKKQGESLKKILEQSQNLVRLINQLLDIRSLARGERRPEPEAVPLSLLARDRAVSLGRFFEDKGVELAVRVPEGGLEVRAPKEDLEKVIDHLLSNALKFTPKGGKVSLEVIDDGRQAQVRVADTGCGIPTESMRFVFQKFYHVDQSLTRAYGGMGLGLAFCKEAVENMGGRIWVESRGPGQGASVVFTLPRPLAAVPAGPPTAKRNILWVDDNPSMLELVEVGFASMSRSMAIKTASGGLEALEMIKTALPDLIVLDIMMADMDGLEVLSRLKADPRTTAVPVLIASGYKEAAKTAVQRGAHDFCLKPFHMTDIVNKIESILFPAA